MDRVILMILVWIGTITTHKVASAPCIYGNEAECFYQCHCRDKSECGGVCTRGCDTSGIATEIRRPWTGATCQVGNVALFKPTNQSSTWPNFDSSKAVDGVIDSGIQSCAHSVDGPHPHHWWLDLGGVFKIYNITIYRRGDCSCPELLSSFKLGVVDDQNKETECARYYNPAGRDLAVSIECHRALLGRYVHLVSESHYTVFCEMVVIGHKYTDCQYCPTECNDVTGCVACDGAYQPDCNIVCDNGFYGTNCELQCGKCSGNTVCNKTSGVCSHGCEDGFYGMECNRTCGKCSDIKCDRAHGLCQGCQMWWTDSKCMTMIALPNVVNETITGTESSSNSLTIEWRPLSSIPDKMVEYYQYKIKYKVNNTADYVNAFVVDHTRVITQSYVIKGLRHNTVYDVFITPERVMNGHVEANPDSRLYGPVSFKTKCIAPDLSTFGLNVAFNDVGKSFPRILLSYNFWEINHGCDSIQNVVLKYNTRQTCNMVLLISKDTSFVISPSAWGQYNIEFTVTNNQGLSSTIYKTVDLVDPSASRSTSVITPGTSILNTTNNGISGEKSLCTCVYNGYIIVAVLGVLLAGCICVIIVTVMRYRTIKKENLRLRAENSDIKVPVKHEPVISDDDTALDYEAIKLETTQERSPETTAYETLRDQNQILTEPPLTYEVM